MPFNFQVTPSGLPKFEPSVAVNLLNPNIVVAVAVDFSSGPPLIGLYRSLDAGADWTDSLLPLPPEPAPISGMSMSAGFVRARRHRLILYGDPLMEVLPLAGIFSYPT
ncbi:hypothetical protein ACIFQM_16770 [Paenibacillus sp. NRS-1782]|uniref:hypothetical protein n=1 Tax=unclassified Paenibacillus TaxID=185978 RepID=UPI003D2BF5D3